MEPYHARSLWGGYTIFGWRTLCTDAGLTLEEVRPSIDAIALTLTHRDARAALMIAWHRLLNREAPQFTVPIDAPAAPVRAKLRLVR